MKTILTAGALLISPLTALADDALVRPLDVLSVVEGYPDDESYKAVLVSGEDGADLYLYDGDSWDRTLALHRPNIAWSSQGADLASLSLGPKDSLRVHSHNSGIGRTRWETTLTIVKREGQYLVGGFTHSWYDTITIGQDGNPLSGTCDLNLFTGKGDRDGKPVKTAFKATAVAKWSVDGGTPAECQWD